MPISDLDPSKWRGSEYTVLAHDFGLTADFSTAVVMGKWTDLGRPVFAVMYAERFPHGLSPTETVERVVRLAVDWRAHEVVADISNQQAHLEALAGASPIPICPLKITSRVQHALDPSLGNITVGGQKARVPIWMLSRTELIDGLYPFFELGTLRITEQGDGPEIIRELSSLSREITRASNVVWTCPPSGHDDMAISGAIGVWAQHYRPACAIIEPSRLKPRNAALTVTRGVPAAGWT
ncbi:hypothetical protein [Pseudohaliea sp.]|uniref:hypothetical protein n=1 Tax=Pseudohaliea sp. TaxID=2740289 RepID=UPI0032F05C35